MDKKLLDALSNISDGIDALVEALKDNLNNFHPYRENTSAARRARLIWSPAVANVSEFHPSAPPSGKSRLCRPPRVPYIRGAAKSWGRGL